MKKIAELAERPAQCCAPLTARSISDDDAVTSATLFKALADKHRVQILNLLANSDEPVCVCDLTDQVGLSQPTMSFHLKKLVSSGLLDRVEEGKWAYYSINSAALGRLSEIFRPSPVRTRG